MVEPTAFGKSLVISKIAKELDAPTIVFQPSKELLLQNIEKLEWFGGEATIYSASCGKKELSNLTYATIGSVKNIATIVKEYGVKYALVDECHLLSPNEESMYSKFFSELGISKVLGFTATPIRLKSFNSPVTGERYSQLNILTRARPRFFSEIIHVTQIQEMTRLGYWSDLEYHQLNFSEQNLVLNSAKSEYTDDSVSEAVKKQGVNNTIFIKAKEQIAEGKKLLIFVDSVNNAQRMAEVLPKTEFVGGLTKPKERAKIVAALKSGEINCIVNYDVFSVGFDVPELNVIHYGRPTNSLAKWIQVVGRGVRIAEGKVNCEIWDYGNNTQRFGKVEEIEVRYIDGDGWSLVSRNQILTNVSMSDEPLMLPEMDSEKGLKVWFGKYKGKYTSELTSKEKNHMLNSMKFNVTRTRILKHYLK